MGHTEQELTTLLQRIAHPLSECYPDNWQVQKVGDLFLVGAPHTTPLEQGQDHRVTCIYYLDLEQRTSKDAYLKVGEDLQGGRIGYTLIQIKERFCREVGITDITIPNCTNPDWWQRQGYQRMDGKVLREFEAKGVVMLQDPHYKRIK